MSLPEEDIKKAKRELQEAEAGLPPDHPDLAPLVADLALCCQSAGDLKQAETLFQR